MLLETNLGVTVVSEWDTAVTSKGGMTLFLVEDNVDELMRIIRDGAERSKVSPLTTRGRAQDEPGLLERKIVLISFPPPPPKKK